MSSTLSDFMGTNMEKVKAMVDANMVVGDPITTPDGVTILPICRINIGIGGGGTEIPGKNLPTGGYPFGGGSGAGVTVTPLAFLITKNGSVRMLPVAEPASSALDRIVENIPDLIDRIMGYVNEAKAKKAAAPEADVTIVADVSEN